ncbi:hypothetical protein PENDEC_c003G01784 [Penicillium decumbens]|uniref:Uncharacterized protein n=1 Tax=Penicillium decumbens TaxID=69771 RepID=A0A1V6PJA5_PENDC|nr:hypothetical protein PENDEC_c003G01784 [Penicillium decumbens]
MPGILNPDMMPTPDGNSDGQTGDTQTPDGYRGNLSEDQQIALMLLEQQNNRRLMMARAMQDQMNIVRTPDGNSNGQVAQVQPGGTQTPGGQGSNHALRDYQMQLMQLEQQNNTGVPTPDGNSDDQTDGTQTPGGQGSNLSEEHQMAIMLLEQQNKRRLTMARMENEFSCYGQPSPGTSFQGSNGAYSNPE